MRKSFIAGGIGLWLCSILYATEDSFQLVFLVDESLRRDELRSQAVPLYHQNGVLELVEQAPEHTEIHIITHNKRHRKFTKQQDEGLAAYLDSIELRAPARAETALGWLQRNASDIGYSQDVETWFVHISPDSQLKSTGLRNAYTLRPKGAQDWNQATQKLAQKFNPSPVPAYSPQQTKPQEKKVRRDNREDMESADVHIDKEKRPLHVVEKSTPERRGELFHRPTVTETVVLGSDIPLRLQDGLFPFEVELVEVKTGFGGFWGEKQWEIRLRRGPILDLDLAKSLGFKMRDQLKHQSQIEKKTGASTIYELNDRLAAERAAVDADGLREFLRGLAQDGSDIEVQTLQTPWFDKTRAFGKEYEHRVRIEGRDRQEILAYIDERLKEYGWEHPDSRVRNLAQSVSPSGASEVEAQGGKLINLPAETSEILWQVSEPQADSLSQVEYEFGMLLSNDLFVRFKRPHFDLGMLERIEQEYRKSHSGSSWLAAQGIEGVSPHMIQRYFARHLAKKLRSDYESVFRKAGIKAKVDEELAFAGWLDGERRAGIKIRFEGATRTEVLKALAQYHRQQNTRNESLMQLISKEYRRNIYSAERYASPNADQESLGKSFKLRQQAEDILSIFSSGNDCSLRGRSLHSLR